MSFSFLAILAITAAAQSLPPLLVKPGDTVTMPIVVRNIADSTESIDAVRISTTVNSTSIISDPSSLLGPSDISVGGSANFSWTVMISPSAPSGVYRATSRALSASPSVQSADGIDATTQILIVQADVITPTAKVLLEESSGSSDGTSGSASVVVEYDDNEALDKVVLWLDGVAVSTHLLSGKNVKDTFTLDVTAAVSPPARYTLHVYDKTGNSGAQNFELAIGGGGVSISQPFGSGPGTYESPVIDYGGGIAAVLGAHPLGPWSGGAVLGSSGDINFIEGGAFTIDTETHIGSVSCEYGTSDTPNSVAYTNIGQVEVYYKSLTGEFRNVGSGGSITPWKRFQGSKITVSATGNPLPNQISMRCDDGTDNCGNPTPHYIYLSGNFYPDGAGCGQNGTGVVLRVDRNTYLGRNSAVSTDFAQVTFDSVTYGGRTSAYIIPDAAPTGGRIRLETSAYVSGPSVSTISFSALIPSGVSQARLNAITVETVSGAPATLISTGGSSAVLLLSLGSSLVTGVIGEYHITIPPDTTPPSPPTNLLAHKQPNGSVQLTFNAPIDDGFTGQADHLRLEIDRNGVPYRLISIPAGSGGAFQQYQTDILPPGNYSFKLHGVDELGAPSSNVTASVYAPVNYGGGGFVGDQRQATLSSGQSFAANIVSQDDLRLSVFQQAASVFGANVVTVGGIFEVVSPDTQLSGPASLTARFSSAEAVAQGVDPASLSLVRLSSDTLVAVAQNIGGESVTVDITTVTAELYAIVGMVSVFPDTSAPMSQLSYSSDAVQGAGGIVSASQTTLFTIAAADPSVGGSSTTGVSAIIYYLDVPTAGDPLDILASTAYAPITYSGPFSINPGTHTIGYFSADGHGNMELLKFATVSIQLQTDLLPPRSTFIAGNPSASISSATVTYVSSTSLLGFSVFDDSLAVNDGLGVGATQTFYALDGGTYGRFASSFSLVVEGAHSLSFYSIDVVGNEETPNLKSIFVDRTPPVTQLNQNGAEIALSAFDASIAGGASGVGRIRYLVDFGNPEVCNNVAEDTSAARGTCENPWYDGPFMLSNGPHTLSFQAFDAVGNAEPLQTAYPYVDSGGNGGPSAGGMGIGKDSSNALWTVVLDSGAVAFAHANSSGTTISSATLQDGGSDFPWSVLFGQDGRAYAIGAAEGPETQALDLAIYKASPAGDAIESRTLFDSGYAKNDIVFDAKSPGWIVGAAQTSGPANLDEPGEITFSMALWRFDPALGTVQLKTTYARASFDLGAGLAVDPDGSLWVAGYSLSPENPTVGGFDLALWHYAANGQTLLGGPYLRPGYLNDLDAELATKVFVTTQAVYIAATRVNSAGSTDMAFLRYDKSSGQPITEAAWRSAGGEPSYPMAILPEASGMLVVGGIGAASTQAALWRFGFDGALQNVTTTEAGGARGAVFKDTELWLSVDGSTVPYHVEAEAAATGALIDLAPPRSSLSAGAPTFGGESTVYVTSATPLGFAVIDDYAVPGDGLGVGATQTFYAEGGGAFSRFTSSFTLVAEGTHTVAFFSIDREGRAEAVKTQSVGVDLTAPVVTLVSSGSLFSLSAVDPLVGGAASGVKLVQYLVDQDPECNVEPSTAAAPGTCQNLTYAGPFELAIGTHTVYYAAEDNLANGLEVVYSSYITVGQPITGPVLTPSSGPIGVPFSITGTGFGVYSGANTRVKFGTLTAPVSVWNDTTIKGTIPGLSTGAYAVAIERQNASSVTVVSAGNFAVTDLNSAALNVSSGPIGVPFTFAGSGFGPYAGTLSRVLVDGATAPLSVWNDTTITGTIPGVAPGAKTIVIQRAAGTFLSTSDGFAFTVTVPSVTAVSPSSGPIGAAFALSGRSFGPYAGTLTRVLIGGATAPLSLWNDATIKGTVPGALSPGLQAVVVERRTAGGGLVQSGTAYFQVAGLAVSSLAPSSGPIGIPFTVSGMGFGAYDGANTRVRFGVSTAALSLWNDTTIKGTIPALAAGDWSVVVERQQGAAMSSASAGTFTATALSVSAIVPSSGPIGAPFTITGSQFGVYGGANTRVTFNGVAAPLSVWSDTTITGTVPALSTGTVDVVVERQQGGDVSASSISSFSVVELAPSGFAPASGPIGTAFTITGTGFGPYAGANTRVLVGGATAALSLWNDTTITGTIPNLPAGSQPAWIERAAGTGVQSSATSYFDVTVPAISALAPSSAPIGAPFSITGTSFGVYAGANTRVLFNGVSAALSVWNDTTIAGTVPALPAGEVGVIVERLQGGGAAESASAPFLVVEPSANPVAPSAGPIGTVFTITGSGFGPYAGANTRVLIGGTTAALSLWNDTTIKGTIPNLPTGTQAVWLERSAGSGVASSATSYFTVTTPAVADMTPSSGPIGAPFTITGASFGAYAGANTRVKFNGIAAPLSVWNDTLIKGTVPGSLAPGATEVVVERAAGTGLTVSATQAFFVVMPAISTIAPSYGPAGTVVTVTGSGFGPYSGTSTKLLVGGSTVPLSVWNDTTIRWTVPAFLADGEHPVIVERSPAGGTVQSASATFTAGTPFTGGESLAFSATLSLAATPDSYFEGDMSLSSATGGRIDTPAKAAVDIPPNAMEEDTAITLKRLPDDGRREDAADEIHRRAAGEPIEFGPEGTRFSAPVTIELPYDPALAADETKIAIHYYNPLRREWEELPSVVDRARKVVTAKTDHFSIYQPMGLAPTAASQDEFYFRDAYAYPNPSRGGARVTFRIQPGLAETVEVRVYDLSGRKIHESSDFTFLGAIDDGNGKGAQNTYDHAWGVSGVGSGVYNFVIKASQRGHKPIVKTGKAGVIK